MRVDTEQASGAQSHTISNGERTWVWYGGSELYYESAAAFTADEEQGIPTYEDILRLDKKRIAAADYRLLDTVDCIFVETAADDGGYIERYWVSVSNGLLCAAEKLQGEDVVYRMAGMSVDSGNVAEDAFTLPRQAQQLARHRYRAEQSLLFPIPFLEEGILFPTERTSCLRHALPQTCLMTRFGPSRC